MADNSEDIPEFLQFHPCNGPQNMLFYDRTILTDNQQIQLNKTKINTVRENEIYLAKHPEIRALVALATRSVLKCRPRINLHQQIGRYFSKPRSEIQDAVESYLSAREPHIYEGNSGVMLVQSDEWQCGGKGEQESTKGVSKEDFNLDDDNCDIATQSGESSFRDQYEIMEYLGKTTGAGGECEIDGMENNTEAHVVDDGSVTPTYEAKTCETGEEYEGAGILIDTEVFLVDDGSMEETESGAEIK